MVTIKVKDKDVALAFRMGAMRIFHTEFGKEFEAIRTTVDMAEFVFCCAKCAARADNKALEMTIDEFCDNVSIEDVSGAFLQLAEESGVSVEGDDSKKK